MVAHLFIRRIIKPTRLTQLWFPRSRYRFCLAVELSDVQSCLRLPVLQSVWEEGLPAAEAVL